MLDLREEKQLIEKMESCDKKYNCPKLNQINGMYDDRYELGKKMICRRCLEEQCP